MVYATWKMAKSDGETNLKQRQMAQRSSDHTSVMVSDSLMELGA